MNKKFKFILLLTLLTVNTCFAKLGWTLSQYKEKYGSIIDDSIPSPTGENWVRFKLEGEGKLFVMFEEEKSVVERYILSSSSQCESKMQKQEAGVWAKTKVLFVFKSPSDKIFAHHEGTTLYLYLRKEIRPLCGGISDYSYYQDKIKIKRKPRFSKASPNKHYGLGMSLKESTSALGAPITQFDSIAQFKKYDTFLTLRFDKGKKSYLVVYDVSILTGKKLKEILKPLDEHWDYYGAYGISKSKKYFVKVELDRVVIFDAFRYIKYVKRSIPSLRI